MSEKDIKEILSAGGDIGFNTGVSMAIDHMVSVLTRMGLKPAEIAHAREYVREAVKNESNRQV